jgi:hypothetical protein
MNKRSAMFVAGGLVVALFVAGVAMAMGVTGPSADAKTTTSRREPIVQTRTRTVTVHKTANGDDDGAVIVKTLPADDATTPGHDGAYEDDDAYEDHESDDDESDDASEDHEDGGSDDDGTEDHESDDD